MKAGLVLVQQESISVSIIRGLISEWLFFLNLFGGECVLWKDTEVSLLSCFFVSFSAINHRRVCPPPPFVRIHTQQVWTLVHRRPQPGGVFSTLIAYGLHRGTAEQRSSELLLAQLVT